MYKRKQFQILKNRLLEKKPLIQVLWGPRQVGKTTLIEQVLKDFEHFHFASADEPQLKDGLWLTEQWEIARLKSQQQGLPCVLVIDEIQKITNWSETVKLLWDEDKRKGMALKVVLLGSSSLLIQKGLTESLTGRFELIPIMHWSFGEMHDAFGWDMNTYIYYGGYPGAAVFLNDPPRWRRFLLDAIVETTLSRDIMLLTRIDKPALMRQLFFLGCHYSGQILSYQKMMGQLQDAGNTTTLAHYLQLLQQSCLLTGLEKFSGKKIKQRASSPKLQTYNSALYTVSQDLSLDEALNQPQCWGRFVETSIGTHLINSIQGSEMNLYYWREADCEVDYILTKQQKTVAIEVKSVAKKQTHNGLVVFATRFETNKVLLVGGDGMSLEDFLRLDITTLFGQ